MHRRCVTVRDGDGREAVNGRRIGKNDSNDYCKNKSRSVKEITSLQNVKY